MLALYGHPFSSYTWKALIAFYANDIDFEFRIIDADHMDNVAFVQAAGPLGKFPVLRDGAKVIFESTSIIENLALRHGDGDVVDVRRQSHGWRLRHVSVSSWRQARESL